MCGADWQRSACRTSGQVTELAGNFLSRDELPVLGERVLLGSQAADQWADNDSDEATRENDCLHKAILPEGKSLADSQPKYDPLFRGTAMACVKRRSPSDR